MTGLLSPLASGSFLVVNVVVSVEIVSPLVTCKPLICSQTASMMTAVSSLIPFEPVSPLPVTTWVVVTVVLVTAFFNGPFGDGVDFVTVDVVVFLMGVNFLAAKVFVVRVVVVNVDAVVRVVLTFGKIFVVGLCSKIGKFVFVNLIENF